MSGIFSAAEFLQATLNRIKLIGEDIECELEEGLDHKHGYGASVMANFTKRVECLLNNSDSIEWDLDEDYIADKRLDRRAALEGLSTDQYLDRVENDTAERRANL